MKRIVFIISIMTIMVVSFLHGSLRAQNSTGTGAVTSTTGPNNSSGTAGSVSGDINSGSGAVTVSQNNTIGTDVKESFINAASNTTSNSFAF